jgi:hypothetical protein
MNKSYNVKASSALADPQQVENLFLEACDIETRALLRLAIDINIWSCQHSDKPKLTVHCHSREVTEAIGIRQAYIKSILKQIIGCPVSMSLYYNISEGQVHFDTEGEVAPARWYLCNRKDCGQMKIPLPG